jgi:hypothetical protein
MKNDSLFSFFSPLPSYASPSSLLVCWRTDPKLDWGYALLFFPCSVEGLLIIYFEHRSIQGEFLCFLRSSHETGSWVSTSLVFLFLLLFLRGEQREPQRSVCFPLLSFETSSPFLSSCVHQRATNPCKTGRVKKWTTGSKASFPTWSTSTKEPNKRFQSCR